MTDPTSPTDSAQFADVQEAKFLAEHPEISEAVPSWADDVLIDFDDVDTENLVTFTSERMVGMIEVVELGTFQGGEVSAGLEFSLWFPADRHSERTGRELASYARSRAVELLTIAAMLEAEDAS